MNQTANDDQQPPPLTRKIKLFEIDHNDQKTIEINDGERAAIMELLDLQDLQGLKFTYRLRPGSGKRVVLSGRLRAEAVQTCVVSLQPIEARVDEEVDVEFWPIEKIEALRDRPDDPRQTGERDWPEAIEGDTIDLGPLVYETLATSLDPYPKSEGAEFQWKDKEPGAEIPENNPFAVLKSLKKS